MSSDRNVESSKRIEKHLTESLVNVVGGLQDDTPAEVVISAVAVFVAGMICDCVGAKLLYGEFRLEVAKQLIDFVDSKITEGEAIVASMN